MLEPATVKKMLDRLAQEYPSPAVGLQFKNPWELLIATILAAQANDKVINEITPILFKQYPGPKELAEADIESVQTIIRRSGTFKQKALRIIGAAQTILDNFGGKVPEKLEELLMIPGVARKTANVVLSNAFNKPQGIVVDTHVLRVCYRTGLSMQKDPTKMEKELLSIVPREQWGVFDNRIKLHGQLICQARKPLHEKCILNDICPKHEYVKGQ